MAQQATTILEKAMEAGRAFVVGGVLLTLIAGLMVTSGSTTWVLVGWIVGVIAVAVFLYGLVTVHAATTEALIRARLADMGLTANTHPEDAP